MANTPLGYPYPVGTDRVMDGDDAIKALAQAVDTKLGAACSGTATIAVGTVGSAATVAVTFPVGRFTAPPMVIAGPVTGAPQSVYGAVSGGVTATGCNLVGNRTVSTGNVTVNYYAVQLTT